ncbi:hypothetical protein SLE2022_117450 [Rubroshorea leprosula]
MLGVSCLRSSTIDVPGSFLFEWWSVFWDILIGQMRSTLKLLHLTLRCLADETVVLLFIHWCKETLIFRNIFSCELIWIPWKRRLWRCLQG